MKIKKLGGVPNILRIKAAITTEEDDTKFFPDEIDITQKLKQPIEVESILEDLHATLPIVGTNLLKNARLPRSARKRNVLHENLPLNPRKNDRRKSRRTRVRTRRNLQKNNKN